MNILVAKNGSQLGPFSESDIHAKLASGELAPTDLGWKEGMPSWSPLSQMFAASAPTPPAPAAPPPQQTYPPQGQNNPAPYSPQPQTYAPQAQPQAYAPPPYNAPQGQYSAPQTYNSPYPSPYQQGAMPPWGAQGAGMYGGFWIRVVAAIIDGIVLGIPLNLIGYTLISAMGSSDGLVITYPLDIIVYVLYFSLLESSAKQASLGKMAVGLKVTDEAGNRIGTGRAVGRILGKYVSGFLLGVGFIMVGFTQRKQGLHDMMASTLVVKR